ncbi:MAG TPA: gamma-glutamyltransferase [Thermoanaerobaculia bacterium]|nr:gamma-glutamyltransferase [Thermoanaerobaculia bacterium]
MKGAHTAAFLLLLALASQARGGSQVVAKTAALSTASPHATLAGLHVLREGGNAADAAVAVAFVLAVVHPQAGNIGGGGFCVYYEAKSKGIWTLDFREVAPLAATREMYVQPDGMPGERSRTGPLAAGVPGSVAGLAALHARFGTRAWKDLLDPAIALAREGIRADEELSRDLMQQKERRAIDQFPATAALFFPGGKALGEGTRLVQPDLAATLQRIADRGADGFYQGETAERLVEQVRAAGGILSFRDLREYKPVWRAPIRLRFGRYEIYTMAPPSAGGLVLGESLNILGSYDLKTLGFQSAKTLHLMAEAFRRAAVDRMQYVGDPATSRIPYRELLSKERAEQWRQSIDPNRLTPTSTLSPPGGPGAEGAHTTHFTIVDGEGNIASLTTTLNENFGSGYLVPGLGFFLNNEMDDFATAPGRPNRYGLVQGNVNAIEPRKRMASSMTPAIVLRDGRPFLALGSRGGPTIPTQVLQVFLNVAVYGMGLREAVAAPRFHHQALPDQIDYERQAPKEIVDALNAMGHAVSMRDAIGDVHAVMIEDGRLTAVADPRRGGAAGGF